MKIRLLQWKTFYTACTHPNLPKKCNAFLFLFFLLTFSTTVLAQQVIITGRVISGDTALSGVSVSVKSTGTTTQTDARGLYSISAPPNGSLIFSYVGITTQEIKISNRTNIDVSMQEESQQLNDVVVVGYGTQRKGSVTGAVSSIRSSDLMRTPSATTSGALVGKIQGITARQTTGRPGAAATIQVRNLGSPLFVIDGVPQSEGQFNNIGMEDIENISVLKDASASLYGFRASNGVVLVTTKKGKSSQKNSLNVSTYYQLQVNGQTAVDVPVEPFFIIKNESFEKTGTAIRVTFTLQSVNATKTLELARIYIGPNLIVDQNNNSANTQILAAAINNLTQPVTLNVNIPASIANDNFIFARIGVKTNGVAELLYTMPQKIQLK